MNDFQKAMLNNIDVAWQIVKVFHPDIDDSLKEKLSITIKYDWIILRIKKVSIGIEFECHLMSGYKRLELFEQERKNNKFRAWRFVDDSKYNLDDCFKDVHVDAINSILKQENIPKPTAKQMSDYYHSD